MVSSRAVVAIVKKPKVLLLGLILSAVGYVAFCLAYDRYEEWRHTRPQRLEAKRQAYLNQKVRGRVSDADAQSAVFRTTYVAYCGNVRQEWEYKAGVLTYRAWNERDVLVHNVSVSPDDLQRSLLLDILNLVVKQQLWRQSDVFPAQVTLDGGAKGYEFTVGGKTGRFKVVNSSPEHLDLFEFKCGKLLGALREAH
jgi:hypothetical protein